MNAPVPEPRPLPAVGHLWHWTVAPLHLLRAGAEVGPVFRLRLWRPTLVGYSPAWNRAVLGDTATFRSRGSLSGLTPYLAAGIVHTDAPGHAPRKRQLNQSFGARSLHLVEDALREVASRHRPTGDVDAVSWSGTVVRRMLNEALFGGAVPDTLLARYLTPLHRRLPVPLVPRPRLVARLEAAILRVLDDPPSGSIAALMHGLPDAVTELRVALGAGYDTTSHTLAWAVWHLAEHPDWASPDLLRSYLDEILRVYPAGWIGSRVAAHDTVAAGVRVPAGTLVLYSPYLTHHDADLWPAPDTIAPERFTTSGRPPFGYLPFAAGPRTCLGAHLARLMLTTATTPLCGGRLTQLRGDARPRTGITLRPNGPLVLRMQPAS